MRNYLNKILIAPIVILAFLLNPLITLSAVTHITGQNTGDLNTDSSSVDIIRLGSFTASNGTGTIKTGTGRLRVSSAGSFNVRMVVYSNVAGTPTTLLSTSDATSVSSTSYSDVAFTFSGANQITITNGTTYWIGFHSEDPGAISAQVSKDGTSTQRNMTDTYSDGSPTTFSETSNSVGTINLFIYAEDSDYLGQSFPLINPNLYDSGLRIDFDGVDERLVSANNPSFSSDTKTNGRSLCMWFNMDTLPASETSRILWNWAGSDGQGNWSFRMRTDRATHSWTGTRFEFQTANDTGGGSSTSTFMYSSATTFTTATLYHICFISSGSAWSLYVNGSSVTLTVSATGVGGNDGDWWGNVAGSGTITFGIGSTTFDGQIDDVAYFLDDLTATEVSLLYNGGKPIHPQAVGLTDLDHYWKLGESDNGSATTIYDSKGTDNFAGSNVENADIIPTNYY